MNLTYLRSIGLDVVVDCTADCPADQDIAGSAAQVSPAVSSHSASKVPKTDKNQGSKCTSKKADDEAAKATRAAIKAAKQREKEVSQSLSMLLRHRAREVGVHIDGAGWVAIQDALAWMNSFEGDDAVEGPPVTEDEVRVVVSASDKQRFEIRAGLRPLIRASQGHSIPGIELDLELLTGTDVPCAVHGTYFAAWDQIQRTGLKSMERNHIHLAMDLPGASGVISGMRSSCEVLIWVDVCRAEAAGMAFYRSANGVILTEGINCAIPPEFFSRVVDRKTGVVLDAR